MLERLVEQRESVAVTDNI